MAVRAAVLSVLMLAMVGPAFADDQSGTAQPAAGHGVLRAACKVDIEALCKDVQPGGGRIKACLQNNWDKVSQGCKDGVAQAKAHRPASTQSGTSG